MMAEFSQTLLKAMVLGGWFVVVPSLLLVLTGSLSSMNVVALRRAWLACLLVGLVAFGWSLLGKGVGLSLWRLPEPDPGASRALMGLVMVYVLGAAFILGRTLMGWLTLQRWSAHATPVSDPRVVAAFEVAKAAYALHRPCYILSGSSIPAPISVGWFHHRVLLPDALLQELDDAELRDLALHEMAHLKRRDPAAFAWAVLATAVLWPNPLVWLTVHQLKLTAEKVADEAVIQVTEEVKAYSHLLLKMANYTTKGPMVPLAAGVHLHKSFFIQRAEALITGFLTGVPPKRSAALAWMGYAVGTGAAFAFAPAWQIPTANQQDVGGVSASEPATQLIAQGLFPEEQGYLLPDVGSRPEYEARWLDALGLSDTVRLVMYKYEYGTGDGKLSMFRMQDDRGQGRWFILDRGAQPMLADQKGTWLISTGSVDQARDVLPTSAEEQAIVHVLTAWGTSVYGRDVWRDMLRTWPEDVEPGTVDHALLSIGESLETFREIRKGLL